MLDVDLAKSAGSVVGTVTRSPVLYLRRTGKPTNNYEMLTWSWSFSVVHNIYYQVVGLRFGDVSLLNSERFFDKC